MRTLARSGLGLSALLALGLIGCGILGGGEQTAPPLPPTIEGQLLATETPTSAPPPAATSLPTAKAGDALFVSKGQVWAVAPDGSNLRQMTALPDGAAVNDLTVSPDGKYAAYTINRAMVEALDLTTGERSTLDLANQARYEAVTWSPESDRVYFHKLILDANSAPSKSQIWAVNLPPGGAPERVFESDLATGPMALPVIGMEGRQILIHEYTPGGDAGNWRGFVPGTDAVTAIQEGFGVWDTLRGFRLLFRKDELTPGQFSVPIGLYTVEGDATPARVSPLDDDLAAYTNAKFGLLTDQIAALRVTQDANGVIASGVALLLLGEGDVFQLSLLPGDPGAQDVDVGWADATHVVVQRLRGEASEIWLLPIDGSAGVKIADGEQPAVVGGR